MIWQPKLLDFVSKLFKELKSPGAVLWVLVVLCLFSHYREDDKITQQSSKRFLPLTFEIMVTPLSEGTCKISGYLLRCREAACDRECEFSLHDSGQHTLREVHVKHHFCENVGHFPQSQCRFLPSYRMCFVFTAS